MNSEKHGVKTRSTSWESNQVKVLFDSIETDFATKDEIKYEEKYCKNNFLSTEVSCWAQSEGVMWAIEIAQQKLPNGLSELNLNLKSVFMSTRAIEQTADILLCPWAELPFSTYIK